MADAPGRKLGPFFQRVLDCFETKTEFAEALGSNRYLVNYWTRLGFIPHKWCRRASIACIRAGGKVTEGQLLTEADRYGDLIAGLRLQGVKGRSHRVLRAHRWTTEPDPVAMPNRPMEVD